MPGGSRGGVVAQPLDQPDRVRGADVANGQGDGRGSGKPIAFLPRAAQLQPEGEQHQNLRHARQLPVPDGLRAGQAARGLKQAVVIKRMQQVQQRHQREAEDQPVVASPRCGIAVVPDDRHGHRAQEDGAELKRQVRLQPARVRGKGIGEAGDPGKRGPQEQRAQANAPLRFRARSV